MHVCLYVDVQCGREKRERGGYGRERGAGRLELCLPYVSFEKERESARVRQRGRQADRQTDRERYIYNSCRPDLAIYEFYFLEKRSRVVQIY